MKHVQSSAQTKDLIEHALADVALVDPIGRADPVEALVAQRRRAALSRTLERANQLGAQAQDLQEITANLSASAFSEINANPFFCRWLHHVVEAIRQGGRELPHRLAPLGNLLLIPALRDGLARNIRMDLEISDHGTAALFARSGGGHLLGLSSDTQITVRDCAVSVLLASGTRCDIAIETILGDAADTNDAHFKHFERVDGSNIIVDADDPWIQSFFDALNRQDARDRTPDLCGAALARGKLDILRDTFALIERSRPDMKTEMDALVVQIAPFNSSWRRAFTNTSWQGLIFLNADLSDRVALIDRLTHETSHLRLNAIQTLTPLHTWSRDKTVPSPFRSGPRPVDGVFHGVFVFSRVCKMLRCIAQVTNDPGFDEPIEGMRKQIRSGLDALEALGGATPLGARLIKEVFLADASLDHWGESN